VLKCSNVIPRLFAHRVHVIPHTTVCSLRKLTTLRCLCVNLYLRDGRADGRTDGRTGLYFVVLSRVTLCYSPRHFVFLSYLSLNLVQLSGTQSSNKTLLELS